MSRVELTKYIKRRYQLRTDIQYQLSRLRVIIKSSRNIEEVSLLPNHISFYSQKGLTVEHILV